MIFIILSAALFMSFLFSSSEMAFISSNPLLLYVRSKRSKSYKRLFDLIMKPNIFLYTTLIGNNIALVLITIFGEERLIKHSGLKGSLIFSIIFAFIVLIFGEILPKEIAKNNPEGSGKLYAPIIKLFYVIFYPIVYIISSISKLFFLIMGVDLRERDLPRINKSDFYYIVMDELNKKETTTNEARILKGIFRFSDKRAYDIIIPRTDIVSVDKNDNYEEIKKNLIENKKIFTRIPVYENNEDNIVGILNIKEFIVNRNKKIEELMENPFFAPETIGLETLLFQMKDLNVHMAVIIDEYGALTGIATIEDIIEELMGEIMDEYDVDDIPLNNKDRELFNGDEKIEDINMIKNIKIPENNFYETIAGFVIYKLGRIPNEGDIVKINNFSITVIEVSQNTVLKVNIEKKE